MVLCTWVGRRLILVLPSRPGWRAASGSRSALAQVASDFAGILDILSVHFPDRGSVARIAWLTVELLAAPVPESLNKNPILAVGTLQVSRMKIETPDHSTVHWTVSRVHPMSSILVPPFPNFQLVFVPVATKAIRNTDKELHFLVLLIYNSYRTSSSPTSLYIATIPHYHYICQQSSIVGASRAKWLYLCCFLSFCINVCQQDCGPVSR